MSFLLDTNTWVSLLRWQNAGVLVQLQQRRADEILTCSVVLAELWFGAERSDAGRRADNYALVNELQARYQSLSFDDEAGREYAVIRADLAKRGCPIGPNDTMIAAIARCHGVTLVTHNTTEFSRVTDLLLADWQTG